MGLVVTLSLLVLNAAQAGDATADIHWVDVRTAQEYAAGHVEGAVNIPYTEIVERVGEVTDDKDATLYLYCRSGRRSGIATEALEAAGFSQVVNAGGLEDARKKAQAMEH
ncbi:MAG: rhodanese-like domain-containing protein [Xanthomonadales bacterium]|nr:rhodanese-like domain-containing protein [Xanthomonadales bacterium]